MPNPTLLDISKLNGSDPAVGLIEESVKVCPEVRIGFARTIEGLSYETSFRTVLPNSGGSPFRDLNEGVMPGKSVYEKKKFSCSVFNPQWDCDKAEAESYDQGPEAFIALEGQGMLEQSFIDLGRQFYYGDLAKGFPGVYGQCHPTKLFSAGGASANACTSVVAVRWGLRFTSFLWGRNVGLKLSDVTFQKFTDSQGRTHTRAYQEIDGRVGLQVGSQHSVSRLANIDQTNGHGATYKTIRKWLAKAFPTGIKPDVLFMNQDSYEQYWASREERAFVTGSRAPEELPDHHGIPIIPTDSILYTEAVEAGFIALA